MNRKKLIDKLTKNGWYLKRNGGNHDIYTNGIKTIPIPRHSDINEFTARGIMKQAGLK